MANVYDFYKPHLSSEYPEVDGPLTQTCYPSALEHSYDHFRAKEARRIGGEVKDVTLDSFDFFAFHSPYGKLVQKGYARLVSFRTFFPQLRHLFCLITDQRVSFHMNSSTTISFRTLPRLNSQTSLKNTLLSNDKRLSSTKRLKRLSLDSVPPTSRRKLDLRRRPLEN